MWGWFFVENSRISEIIFFFFFQKPKLQLSAKYTIKLQHTNTYYSHMHAYIFFLIISKHWTIVIAVVCVWCLIFVIITRGLHMYCICVNMLMKLNLFSQPHTSKIHICIILLFIRVFVFIPFSLFLVSLHIKISRPVVDNMIKR